jgi:hypothetical protein
MPMSEVYKYIILLILDLVIFDVRYFIVCLYRCDWRSNYQECKVKISLTSAWSFVFCAILCRPLFVFLALLLCVLIITASSYPFGIDHILCPNLHVYIYLVTFLTESWLKSWLRSLHVYIYLVTFLTESWLKLQKICMYLVTFISQ